ncbi:hypothetical protein RclHR1_00050048 [Rhizophagus clarus]|uniref:WD repeat-containing protein 5B-like isoform X1 n=1 Tax=Rhizophagus clarus TaxID=94130 RepID=A0A2Z6S1Z5_9GLOM|nr:hypothetical protein RclHR1_00050048 [Rhizophagus clarus]GES86218.1 WD repeat-containing protein 5B-like isoform X1 [Rhizophagus clarus]
MAALSSNLDNTDKLVKENKALKHKVDTLEKEIMLLKKSIYDLSVKFSSSSHQRVIGHFVIDSGDVSQDNREINLENPTSGNNAHEKHREGRTFHPKSEFKGHGGAVYALRFSPCGKMLASGSFDKTVRIWDTISFQKEQACLKGHNLHVSDVCWSNDSTSILSGSYDQTCKLWEIETSRYIHSFENEGFVQCIMFNPADNNLFANGTSRKILSIIDIRKSDSALKFKNDGMINSLYICRDGQNIITGDSNGCLKTWDIRAGSELQSFLNESTKKPISYVAVSKRSLGSDEEPRYMAVNSYDNVIRIYDRGIEPPKTQLTLIHVLKGYKNRGWPIRSSYFFGKDYQYSAQRLTYDIYDNSQIDSADYAAYEKDKPLEASLLLATGSADPYAYLYNVGGPEETGELIQRLEGHTDFVYAVDFHPFDPILASCSADCSIKIWAPNAKGKKKG